MKKLTFGTIAYHIQDTVFYNNKEVNLDIHNKYCALEVKNPINSTRLEMEAILLGLDMIDKFSKKHPIIKYVPIRIKSDSLSIIRYITGRAKDCDIKCVKENKKTLGRLITDYNRMKNKFPNLKISYIPSKQNIAHYNAFELLKLIR